MSNQTTKNEVFIDETYVGGQTTAPPTPPSEIEQALSDKPCDTLRVVRGEIVRMVCDLATHTPIDSPDHNANAAQLHGLIDKMTEFHNDHQRLTDAAMIANFSPEKTKGEAA